MLLGLPQKIRWKPETTISGPGETGNRLEIVLVWISSVFIILYYALRRGQDINWDQLNYHIYSVYALLHQRYQLDIIPSQLQTYTNPFGNILQYLLIMTMPPWIVSLLLAAIASVSVPLVYALTKATLDKDEGGSRGFRIFVAAISAAGALSSPIFLSEVGTTFNDYCGAVIILFALWLVARDDAVARAYVIAGALFGIAVSLKLTNAVFVFGWAAAIVAIETKQAVRGLLNSAIGFLASYLPIGGIWNAYVYSLFKNPLFPLYNHLFKSDAYAHVPMLDTRFKARSFSAALEYLPKLALGEPTTTELAFRDIRFLVVALLLALALPRVLELRFASGQGAAPTIFNRKRSLFVLFFTMISLAAWLGLFGVERYAVLLEQLAPLVFLILLSLLCGSRRIFAQAGAMGILLIAATSKPTDWGHVALSNDWYAIAAPAHLRENGILFIMLSGEPTAYVIPYLPETDSFIRIEGNMPLDPDVALGKSAKSKIDAHQGEIRTLAPADFPLDQSKQRLENFGLALRGEDCFYIDTKAGRLKSCPLSRS